MAHKVLGQVAPAATTNTDTYTVPAGKSAVCSTLSVCNRGTVTAAYRVAVRLAGAAMANASYIFYDASLPAKATDLVTIGMTLAETDVVTVYSSTADLSFNLFGNES